MILTIKTTNVLCSTTIMKTLSFSKDGTKKPVPTESVATDLQQTNNKLNTKCVFKESCVVHGHVC